jgi:uncharacterized membrane protein YphA (DoxX/SURF4 family)
VPTAGSSRDTTTNHNHWTMAANDVIRILLKAVATFMFFFTGINKLHPSVSPDTFLLLDQGFRNSFMPLWQRLVFDHLEYQMSPVLFKSLIGISELLVCVMLWIGNGPSFFASLMGIFIMIGATVTHVLLDEPYHIPVGLAILFVLIIALSPGSKRKSKKQKK